MNLILCIFDFCLFIFVLICVCLFLGQSVLEDTTLLALKLIFVTLSKQESFLQQIRESGCDLLVTSLDNLLLNINPRSGQADHLLVIAKYECFSVLNFTRLK